MPTKKVWAAPKTDVTAKVNVSAQSVPTVSLQKPVTFLSDNAELIFNNVGIGKDDTLFALIDGVVKFEKYDKTRRQVSVYPIAE